MGNELRVLFQHLFEPGKEAAIRRKMGQILSTAHEIGGSISQEAEALNRDVVQFLEKPQDRKNIAVMKNHALKLEQETREL